MGHFFSSRSAGRLRLSRELRLSGWRTHSAGPEAAKGTELGGSEGTQWQRGGATERKPQFM